MDIPFNRPFMTGAELGLIRQAHANGVLSGGGPFSARCSAWLRREIGCLSANLTHSCTAALEMAAILLDIRPGEEVIMPSFTFPSTANAVVLRGGVPVFVDIRADTMNIDEQLIEEAITDATRAILVVHYAGVASEMEAILDIARRHDLQVIEDSAQGVLSRYDGKPLGSFGDLACVSFHETKNIISGEGGALLVNSPAYLERAEIVAEKGTDRSRFFRGEVDRYSWVDIGSSFLPNELTAAFLAAQMEQAEEINGRRMALWQSYHEAFADLEASGIVRRPVVPDRCAHNAHLYYLLLAELDQRTRFIADLKQRGIATAFHYVPLHDSLAGRRYCRAHGRLPVTIDTSERLVRLPLWLGLEPHQSRVIEAVHESLREGGGGE